MSIIAGAAMSVQGVFNTRLGDKTGLYEANVIVSLISFICALVVMLIMGKGSIGAVREVNKIYLLGGVIGTLITISVMLSIKNLSPVYATAIILISQLTVSAIIDGFGLFDTEQIVFGVKKFIGLGVMIAGIIIFKK